MLRRMQFECNIYIRINKIKYSELINAHISAGIQFRIDANQGAYTSERQFSVKTFRFDASTLAQTFDWNLVGFKKYAKNTYMQIDWQRSGCVS